MERRVKAHFSELKDGRHRNLYLQRAFNKYGMDAFTWEFMECVEDDLMEMEQYFISNTEKSKLFNMDPYVRKTPKGLKRSDDTSRRISAAKKGIPNPKNAGDRNGSKRPEVIKRLTEFRMVIPPEQCLEIFESNVSGLSQSRLAEIHNCHRSSIRNAIKYAKTYLT